MEENNKITESQYLEALEVIQAYRDQINAECKRVLNESITVERFLEIHGHEMSKRLFNCLNKRCYSADALSHFKWEKNTYLSDIKFTDLLKLRNFGKKCLTEFEWLGKQYGVDFSIK